MKKGRHLQAFAHVITSELPSSGRRSFFKGFCMRILTGQGFSNKQLKHGRELLEQTRDRMKHATGKPTKGQKRQLRKYGVTWPIIKAMTFQEAQAAVEEYWRREQSKHPETR